jgi:hypothetical protein
MNDRIVSTDAIMASICKWYNRKATKDGLRLAWIESAVNDTPTFSAPSGWVSVDDRLPEDDGFVVAFIESGTWDNITFARCIEIASYDTEDGCGWVLEHYPMAKVNITHWMDPPDPLGRKRLTLDDLNEGRVS